jgi:hypothetical protein
MDMDRLPKETLSYKTGGRSSQGRPLLTRSQEFYNSVWSRNRPRGLIPICDNVTIMMPISLIWAEHEIRMESQRMYTEFWS